MSELRETDVRSVDASAWESAYLRFETRAQEIRKFTRRLRSLGVDRWSREDEIAELFCGRGSGLRALESLGFRKLVGVDLSSRLTGEYDGPAEIHVADCRNLPFSDASLDGVIIQGGLHHLEELPEDLRQVLQEIGRVLRPRGRVVVVEPWLTPFLSLVHYTLESRILRALWPKLDALGVMVEHERETYEAWLAQPGLVLREIDVRFERETSKTAWGKISFVASKR